MKKLGLNIFVAFVVFQVIGSIHHGYFLKEDYDMVRLTGLIRTEEEVSNHYFFMLAAQLIMSIAFVIIYRMGKESKPWLGQGIRYGILIAMIATIPNYLTYYSIEPLPGMLVFKQTVLDTIMILITSVIIARLEQPGHKAVIGKPVPEADMALSVV